MKLPPGFTRFHTEPTPKRGELAIVAHYKQKPPKPSPITLRVSGRPMTVSVRAVLQPRRAFAAAAFDSIYPGAAIAVDLPNGVRESGAICALLSANADDPAPTHLLTCGHLFPTGSTGIDVVGGISGVEQTIGTLKRNVLESSPQRDLALVELTSDARDEAAKHGNGPKLVDYLVASLVFARPSYAYRPTMGGYSAKTQTNTVSTSAHVVATQWPNGFAVTDGIGTTGLVSSDGDSGTILCTDDKTIAIGVCSGSGGGTSLFEPIGRAIDDVFSNLTLWRNR